MSKATDSDINIQVRVPLLEATKKWENVKVPKELPNLVFVGSLDGWYVEYKEQTLGPFKSTKELETFSLAAKLDLHPSAVLRSKLKIFANIDVQAEVIQFRLQNLHEKQLEKQSLKEWRNAHNV